MGATQTFIQPSLLHHASRYGINFVPISIPDSTTTSKTLIEQGPFNCIIHKIYGPPGTNISRNTHPSIHKRSFLTCPSPSSTSIIVSPCSTSSPPLN
ncbi:unnamed protein product [Malus baccata var. baccata]